jgi:hypothetical protein
MQGKHFGAAIAVRQVVDKSPIAVPNSDALHTLHVYHSLAAYCAGLFETPHRVWNGQDCTMQYTADAGNVMSHTFDHGIMKLVPHQHAARQNMCACCLQAGTPKQQSSAEMLRQHEKLFTPSTGGSSGADTTGSSPDVSRYPTPKLCMLIHRGWQLPRAMPTLKCTRSVQCM